MTITAMTQAHETTAYSSLVHIVIVDSHTLLSALPTMAVCRSATNEECDYDDSNSDMTQETTWYC